PVRRLRILLAEDNAVNQKLAVRMLEKMGHQVVAVEDGRLAVERLQENEVFELIIMDIHMPEMDGYAATKAIREWESRRGGHIPIIAMTANAMAGDREKCLEKGMDDYVAKPICSKELERAIQHASEIGFNQSAEEPLMAKNGLTSADSADYLFQKSS